MQNKMVTPPSDWRTECVSTWQGIRDNEVETGSMRSSSKLFAWVFFFCWIQASLERGKHMVNNMFWRNLYILADFLRRVFRFFLHNKTRTKWHSSDVIENKETDINNKQTERRTDGKVEGESVKYQFFNSRRRHLR